MRLFSIPLPEIPNKLLSISAATTDQVLKSVRVKYRRKGSGTTKPGSLLKNQIPIRTHNQDITHPGFREAEDAQANSECGASFSI